MTIILPTQNTLCEVFRSSSPFSRPRPKTRSPFQEHPLKSPIFTAWSAIDNVKDKAGGLTNEAAREFEKASSIAQQKAGAIELYSPKYYAACTIGGILACVGCSLLLDRTFLIVFPGHNTYSRYSPRSCQVQTSSRLQSLQGQFRGLGKDWAG